MEDNQSTLPQPQPPRWLIFKQSVLEFVQVVVISLAVIIPVRYFLVQPFYVKGASMEPNFYDKEYLVIDELTYRFKEPSRGDVAVFHPPIAPIDYFIKRIIGLPGERVVIRKGQIVIFNFDNPHGFVLQEEPYLSPAPPLYDDVDVTLNNNQYFVMGDNRTASRDSRSFGPVTREEIVGRVWLRGWPFNRIANFTTPVYP